MCTYKASNPSESLGGQARPLHVPRIAGAPGRIDLQPGRRDRDHPEHDRDAALDGHLDEAAPRRPETLPDALESRGVIAAVAGEDEVRGQLPLAASLLVHRRGVQDLGRVLDEGVRELGGVVGLVGLGERLGSDHPRLERLEGDPHRALPSIRRVGVRHLRGERSLVGAKHERPPVLDGRAQFERRSRQLELAIHLEGERLRLLARKVAAHPPVEDLGPVGGREVHPVREVAVAKVHPAPDRLDDAASRMLLPGVVAEDREHRDVGLGRDPRSRR